MPDFGSLGLVVIGRNEGQRLERCLASLRGIPRRVYVDSGSIDGSVALARREGATVVKLEMPPQFTAARARNAGLAQLLADDPDLQFVQMVDGDCEVRAGWIEKGLAAIRAEADLALVFGRRRERYPERSVYNALCDDEWDVPVGEAAGCGGDALFRVNALRQVNFYNSAMIAGEDSELSMRLRKSGWRLRRIDAEMTLHDADLTSFRQWWRRTRRSGHGYGQMAYLHPDAKDPNWPRTVRSILSWGAILPVLLVASILLAIISDTRWWLATALLILLWLLNVARLVRQQSRRGLGAKIARASGVLLMLGKLPQSLGLFGYHLDRLFGRASRLIEYKEADIA
jgi:GT2 family glycosyltransferase